MKRIFILILVAAILLPMAGFAQKREKKKKQKAETNTEEAFNSTEVTNLFIDATRARLAGDVTKAIKLYETCLAKNPKHSASMYELAQLYYNTSDYSTAARYAENASEIEPGNKWYKLLLVEIYGKAGRKKELLATCEKLVEQDPRNLDFLYELANAYLMNDDGNNAIKTYQKIEDLLGVTEEISMQKQRIFLIQNKTDKAAQEMEKLIKEFPDQETRYLSTLAEMYVQSGKQD
jgi:tetratricopeptide (TPR) repeat protein